MSSNTASQKASSRPIRVFISYAHEDRNWLDQILDHLGGLQHMGSLDAFSDTQISAGQEWDPLIKRKLADAEIIILIISANFLGSRYCMSVELKQAIERHGLGAATVIPVIANHCDWTVLPISQLQALPKDEAENLKPLRAWRQKKDVALTAIARQIREIVTNLQRRPDLQDTRPAPLAPPLMTALTLARDSCTCSECALPNAMFVTSTFANAPQLCRLLFRRN